ncbi:MAG: YraN family protein [Bacteroidales bacterium]|nr:YraN family protein [Bacteroidales bacterium]
MPKNKEFGNQGEHIAKEYLQKKGYLIRDCNWRFGHLEIDLIAENKDFIVFFEIKTRSTNYFGEPENFVSKRQQQNIIRTASRYMEIKNCEKEVRFDIISILQSADKNIIKRLENAFSPSW